MRSLFRILITHQIAGLFTLYAMGTMATEIYRYEVNGTVHLSDQRPSYTPATRLDLPAEKVPTVESGVKIYKYVDARGIVHFTDVPDSSRYKLIYENKQSILSSNSSDYSSFSNKSMQIHKRAADYAILIEEVARRYGVEAHLIHAMIQVESAYNPNATSHKGAVGLMQLMPGTASRYGVTDRTDINENLEGGTRYLRDLLALFENNKRLALAAYNAGENAVIRNGNQIPPYRETQNYVEKVLALYNLHRQNP